MENNILGIIISIIYLLLILLIATVFKKKDIVNSEGSRKIIHIGVSLWWIIAMVFFSSPLWAAAIPAVFIVANSFSLKFNIIDAMESSESRGYGTVYYAISLTILAVLCFSGFSQPYIGAIGILTMGFGDGFAAIIGEKYSNSKYKILGSSKSILGNLSMFLISTIIIFIILSIFSPENALLTALILGTSAAVLEAISAKGTDNLTVPLGVSFLYQFVLLNSMFGTFLTEFIIGLVVTSFIVLLTWKSGMLTGSGALAAQISATGFYVLGGFPMWALLIIFFASASLVGKIKKKLKPYGEDNVTLKTGAKDAIQVMANSLPAFVLLLLWRLFNDPVFMLGAIGAIAASNADTWASEIGSLSKKQPISITRFKPIERGLSGGVTLLGTFASVAGSLFIALCALGFYSYLWSFDSSVAVGFLTVVFIGFIGALMDSIIGDRLQAKYKCNVCLDLTEKNTHHNTSTHLVAGVSWIDNDMVNLISSAFAAVSCVLLFNFFY